MTVKLNLGCGSKLWDGFINVDFANEQHSFAKPDVECDLRKLPFDDSYADECHSIHVIEHFYQWEVADILKEWARVLKPGGLLVLECPCMDKVFGYIAACVTKGMKIDVRMTFWALYGDPGWKSVPMTHKWGYTMQMLEAKVKESGFEQIEFAEPKFHVQQRDMRLEARKPCFS